jgi:hypothetical protein
MMMVLFHVWPEQTYRFSTRKGLPPPKLKFALQEKPTFPQEIIESRTSSIPRVKKANIVFKGSSFDIEKLKELEPPIYVVGLEAPPDDPNAPVEWSYENASAIVASGKEVIYICADSSEAREFFELGLPTIFMEPMKLDDQGKISPIDGHANSLWYNQIFGKKCKRISRLFKFHHPSNHVYVFPATGLAAICALQKFAEEINVYGWDFYLNSSPNNMSYWELFFNMYMYKYDVYRSRTHFESAIVNFYYGYHLSQLPNINIYGYMGQLGKHEKLIRRIERVLFN